MGMITVNGKLKAQTQEEQILLNKARKKVDDIIKSYGVQLNDYQKVALLEEYIRNRNIQMDQSWLTNTTKEEKVDMPKEPKNDRVVESEETTMEDVIKSVNKRY